MPEPSGTSRVPRTIASVVAMCVTLILAVSVSGTTSGAQPEGKVTICHAASSASNPYQQITVAPSAVDGEGKGDHYLEHTGPVWREGMAKGTWGDIIPPIPDVHDGLNWSARGKRVWRLGCLPQTPMPKPTPTPIPTPTNSGSPTATPTPTDSGPPTPTPSGSTSPTATATPTDSASPTASPTTAPPDPGEPQTPIVIIPAAPGVIPPGERTTLLKHVRSSGDITIRVTCRVNGDQANALCAKAVTSRRATVRVVCQADITVTVRVTAKAEDMRTSRWTGRWSVGKRGPGKVCAVKGDG